MAMKCIRGQSLNCFQAFQDTSDTPCPRRWMQSTDSGRDLIKPDAPLSVYKSPVMTTEPAVSLPTGHQWLIDRGLVGFEPFTQLQPWHYMPRDQCFWTSERWPNMGTRRLFVFAKRQDNDDLACVSFDENQTVNGVVQIQGWTASGFDIVQEFPDFWLWLQHVIQDISEWTALG